MLLSEPLQVGVDVADGDALAGVLHQQLRCFHAHRADADSLDLDPLAVGTIQLSIAMADDEVLVLGIDRDFHVAQLPAGRVACWT